MTGSCSYKKTKWYPIRNTKEAVPHRYHHNESLVFTLLCHHLSSKGFLAHSYPSPLVRFMPHDLSLTSSSSLLSLLHYHLSGVRPWPLPSPLQLSLLIVTTTYQFRGMFGPCQIAHLWTSVDALHGLPCERVPEAYAPVSCPTPTCQQPMVVRWPGNSWGEYFCCYLCTNKWEIKYASH